VYEHRALAAAHVVGRLLHHRVAREQIAPVDFENQQIGESGHELRDAAAGGVDLDRDGDRVAVVLDQIDDRELEIARRVERLPELAFTRRAVAGRDDHHLVVLESLRDAEDLGPHRRLGRSHGLEELRPRR
jgi:hypothetical protein